MSDVDDFAAAFPDIPIIGLEGLSGALYQMENDGLDPSRPYNGQPWTDAGERGKTEVRGLTMRDIGDCLAVAFLTSCEGPWRNLYESGQATWNDVYEAIAADPDFDPVAVRQALTCEIEKRMGIYPNVPRAHTGEEKL